LGVIATCRYIIEMTSLAAAPVYLSLRMFPHRSLTRPQLFALIGVVSLICGLGALRFAAIGAWPVVAFMLLDVALLSGAFWLNNRSARRFEEVRIEQDALTVRRVDVNQRERRWNFNPLWVRVGVERLPDSDTRLTLAAQGATLEIGRDISAAERLEVADEISAGLARYRAGEPLPNSI
jgi:uncharacterized membrane protein